MAVVSGNLVHLPGKLSAYLEFKLPQLDIFSRGLHLARYLKSGWQVSGCSAPHGSHQDFLSPRGLRGNCVFIYLSPHSEFEARHKYNWETLQTMVLSKITRS